MAQEPKAISINSFISYNPYESRKVSGIPNTQHNIYLGDGNLLPK
jgi:hypothetical protein